MKNLPKLAENIKTARLQARLTQADVAGACNTDTRAYQRWEAGDTEPSASNLLLIANALGVATDELLAGVIIMEAITIYPTTVSKAVEMSGTGDGYACAPFESDSTDYERYSYKPDTYYLPVGYTVGQMPDGSPCARDTDGMACDLVVHYGRPALVSAQGIRLLRKTK